MIANRISAQVFNFDYVPGVNLNSACFAQGTASMWALMKVLLCGSGIGASIAANKIGGVRAAVCHDDFSARQGVEDDDMNILCLGGLTTGVAVAWNCVKSFLAAKFTGAERNLRRLAKVNALGANPTDVYSVPAGLFATEASVQFRSNGDVKE